MAANAFQNPHARHPGNSSVRILRDMGTDEATRRRARSQSHWELWPCREFIRITRSVDSVLRRIPSEFADAARSDKATLLPLASWTNDSPADVRRNEVRPAAHDVDPFSLHTWFRLAHKSHRQHRPLAYFLVYRW